MGGGMPDHFTADEVREQLREQLKAHGSLTAYARAIGITATYLSDILAGKRDPTDRVCEAIGLTRLTVYVPKQEELHAQTASVPPDSAHQL
jgi:transcriptional regulator with XRE-family HTH domain